MPSSAPPTTCSSSNILYKVMCMMSDVGIGMWCCVACVRGILWWGRIGRVLLRRQKTHTAGDSESLDKCATKA